MAWKMVGDPKVSKVTRELAKKFSTMKPVPHDRPMRPMLASVLRRAFDKELFRTCEWATCKCEETGETYRVNGKHTSTVLYDMNGTMPKDLSVVVSHFQCDTMEDVAQLYATFDTRSSARTTTDINLIYSACLPALASLPTRTISHAVTGMSWEMFGEAGKPQQSQEAKAGLMLEYPDFVVWLDQYLTSASQAENKIVARGSVVAAMFRTWKKSRVACNEFWLAVRDGTGTSPKSPDRILGKFLLSHSVEFASGAASNKKTSGRREMYIKCMHAWNAWRTNTTTDLKYFASAPSPAAK